MTPALIRDRDRTGGLQAPSSAVTRCRVKARAEALIACTATRRQGPAAPRAAGIPSHMPSLRLRSALTGSRVVILTPGAQDLAVMGANPMNHKRREAVLETSLRTSAAALASPDRTARVAA